MLSTAFVLGGCVNTPQYSLVKDGDEAQKAGMFDQVSYRIYLEPNFRTPECVAVLPLEVAPEASDAISFDYLPSVDARKAGEVDHSLEFPQSTVAKVGQDGKAKKKAAPRAYRLRFEAADKQRLVRSMLYGFVSAHAPKDIELGLIDRATGGKPVSGARALRAVAKRVGCDWLLTGRITDFNVDFLGVYSSIRIGADLELVRASSGKRVWTGRHVAQGRAGSVPLTPIDLAVGALKAVSNLEPDQLEGVAADLARRLVRTMPLEANNPFLLASNMANAASHVASDIGQGLDRLYRVVAESLNLREGPGINYKVRKVLRGSEEVSFIDHAKRPGWCRVRTRDGQVGYAAVRYLKPVSPAGQGS
ncbi:SH3 domain-containing protein [endosymbiont of unidentified scaly snail isolate Monju]|uniref:SH3 domain-containing protein n=1 Tax=endosymbiont of unidentified scaly snail isolate Monju TaxID=1248727 RepID=UPI001E29A01F|nr:SH3 domain-containing protein [endosymbiont of unidentified scaly snail isolate Monju]